MITWVVVILLIALVLFFIRVRHFRHKVFAVIVILLVFFLYTTASSVISSTGMTITNFDSVVKASKAYFSWLGGVLSNIKDVVGNIIKMEWSPST